MTRATNYALHALVNLARAGREQPVASHAVAKAEGLPDRFLLKILKPLVAARILHSVRGPNGGFRLARPPEKIALLEVIEVVEGPIRGQAQTVGRGEASAFDKRLEAECDKVAKVIRGVLGRVSVKDLAGKAR
jgi:Rrf2 family protein